MIPGWVSNWLKGIENELQRINKEAEIIYKQVDQIKSVLHDLEKNVAAFREEVDRVKDKAELI